LHGKQRRTIAALRDPRLEDLSSRLGGLETFAGSTGFPSQHLLAFAQRRHVALHDSEQHTAAFFNGGESLDPRIVVGEQFELATLRYDRFQSPGQHSPPFRSTGKRRRRCFVGPSRLVTLPGHVLAASVQVLPGCLADLLFPFEIGESQAEFRDPRRSSGLGLRQRLAPYVETSELGFTLGSSPADQSECLGMPCDPGFERLERLQTGSLRFAGDIERTAGRDSVALDSS
jgi:hypothetical protein